MAQLVTRLSDDLLAEVDSLIADGVLESRSEAVRAGLQALVEQRRRELIRRRIADGYEAAPQHEDELSGLDEATAGLVLEEPW
jgi:Arc/MetJ-type ribon-helix-helix transcriptional regulator